MAPDAEIVDLDGLVLAPGVPPIARPTATPRCCATRTWPPRRGKCDDSRDGQAMASASLRHEPPSVPGSWGPSCGSRTRPPRPNAGIHWEFETLPDYLDLLERRPKRLN